MPAPDRIPRLRYSLLPLIAAGMAVAALSACSGTKEVPVEQTVIVEQTVVVERTLIATATPPANRARALGTVFASQVDGDGLPMNPRNAFPGGTSQVHAIVFIEKAAAGTTITGTWFQLGTAAAGTEGQAVVTGDVILSQVAQGGRSRVTFTLKREAGPLPRDAWLFRVYANGVLLKTSSFVISDVVPQAPRVPGTSSLLERPVIDVFARRALVSEAATPSRT